MKGKLLNADHLKRLETSLSDSADTLRTDSASDAPLSEADTGRPFFIYIDVDDTFVRSAGSKRIPVLAVIQHIRELKEQGAILYCWSSGGAEYAQHSAEEFGITDCFVGFLPKPNLLIDDQNISDWRFLKSVHPAECPGHTLDDYRRK